MANIHQDSTPIGLQYHTIRSASSIGYTNLEEHVSSRNSLPISSSHGVSIPTSSPWGTGRATGGTYDRSFEIVPEVTALESTSKDPKLPCFMLGMHQRMDHFLGREDVLRTIDACLLPPIADQNSQHKDKLRSFAICGLGGIGKTQVAVEYAYSRRECFDAIFWLGAEDAKILASSFARISQELGLDDDGSDFAASRDIVMRWLSRSFRKHSGPDEPENQVNWLIIFDNVDNFHVLSDYWPSFGRGSVLVTSRDSFSPYNLFVQNGINMPPLSHMESEALMEQLTNMKAEDDSPQKQALSVIAENLGGLPLAINQMSGMLRSLRSPYTEFLNLYNEEGIEQLFGRATGFPALNNARSLVTVWALDRLSDGTKALLQVISLLDPDDIPEQLLIYKSSGKDHGDYPRTKGQYYTARSELLSTSLISQNLDQEKLSLHRLIQETTISIMSEQELILALQMAMSFLLHAWPFQSMKEHHSVARFSRCEAIFPSVLRLKKKLESLIQGSGTFPLSIRYARLFNDVGW